MIRLNHPFIAELKRYVANQKSNLSPFIMSISDIIKRNNLDPAEEKIIREKQLKLSEVTDMIHAAYDFHRCIQDDNHSLAVKRDNVMSLLIGDYLLAQSSVDMAEIRCPETVGLIARGLEDFTQGEFLKLNSAAVDYDLYAELTCGSLLANACRSTSLLAGRSKTIGDVVFKFGLNTGTAHKLLQLLKSGKIQSCDEDSDGRERIRAILTKRIDNATSLLKELPHVESRSLLLKDLDDMYDSCR